MKNSVVSIYLFVVMTTLSCGQQSKKEVLEPENIGFTIEKVVKSLENPWGMVFLPDGSILVSEKGGKLLLCKDGLKTEISNLPEIYQRGQGGLLDLELHPNYEKNGWLYFSYSSQQGEGKGGHTAIMRAKIENNSLTNKELLYKASPNINTGVHYGSRIEFDNDNYLYFSIGERGERDINPQDLTKDGGKIYRLYDDGRIPEDNPFVDKEGAKKAIYTYGNRNPQGMVKHYETGKIWIHEHGPRGGDEINIIKKGANYGWPTVTYGINYNGTSITEKTEMEGMEQPIHYWTPSIAPSGMTFITSDKYNGWKNSLLVGSLSFQYLERLEVKDNKVIYREKLLDKIGRVRNVRQGPDGFIYVGVEGKGILKLVPKG